MNTAKCSAALSREQNARTRIDVPQIAPGAPLVVLGCPFIVFGSANSGLCADSVRKAAKKLAYYCRATRMSLMQKQNFLSASRNSPPLYTFIRLNKALLELKSAGGALD